MKRACLFAVGLFGLHCSPPPPAEIPKAKPTSEVVAPKDPPPPTATAAPEAPLVRRTVGKSFQVDPDEPLPAGAVARCGTSRMRVSSLESAVVSNTGSIWGIDRVRYTPVLRDLTKGRDVANLMDRSHAVLAPDASFYVAAPDRQDGAIVAYSIPDGATLWEVKVPLPVTMQALFKRQVKSKARVGEIRMAPDATVFAVGTTDGKWHIIDVAQKKLVKSVATPAQSRFMGISSGGARALFEHTDSKSSWASGNVTGYSVVDLKTGATVRKQMFKQPPKPKDPNAPAPPAEHAEATHVLSLDGARVFQVEAGDVLSIDVATGKERPLAIGPRDRWHSYGPWRGEHLEIQPDGKQAVFRGQLLDLSGQEDPQPLPEGLVARSPDGHWTVALKGQRLTRQPEDVVTRESAPDEVRQMVFLADNRLLTAGEKSQLWDTETCTFAEGPQVPVVALAAAREKLQTLVIGPEKILMFDAALKSSQIERGAEARSGALSPDGALMVLGVGKEYGGENKLVLIDSGAPPADQTQATSFQLPIASVAVSPEADAIAVSVGQRYARGGALLQVLSPTGLAVRAQVKTEERGKVQFAGPTKLVHSATREGTSVRKVDTLAEISRINGNRCCDDIAVSPDGKWIATAESEVLSVWEVEHRTLSFRVDHPHRGEISSLAFSPDSRFLASGSADTTVLLWEVSKLPPFRVSVKPSKQITDPKEINALMRGTGSWLYHIKPDGTVGVVPGLKIAAPPLRKVTKLVGSYSAQCAIAENKVRCWGSTRGGVLGVPQEKGATKWSVKERTTPTTLPVKDPVDVQMLGAYACGLEKGGDLICWGEWGPRPVATPGKVLGNIRAFSLMHDELCATDNAGTVSCMDRENMTVRPMDLKDVASLHPGNFHLCARTSAGGVWCRGKNDGDQLGDQTGIDREQFVEAKGLSGVTLVAVEHDATCVVAAKAEVSCWGHFNSVTLPAPTRIPALDGATAISLDRDTVCGEIGARADCVFLSDTP